MIPIIELRNLTKEFHGVPAVRDVSLSLHAGEIHALLGENGAGKSTLSKIIAGVHRPTRGAIYHDGEILEMGSPAEALKRGIAMVFQETSLVPSMTVAQNMLIGSEKLFNSLRHLAIDAKQFLQSLNFHIDPTASVGSLSAAQRQMVEIARAVYHRAKVIVFDEPTAMLTPEESRHFFRLVRRLSADGVSILYITHALEDAMMLSQRITVLRDGGLADSGRTADFTRDRVVSAMIGRQVSGMHADARPKRERSSGRKVVSVKNLSMRPMVRNASFSIYEGQITGIFGLVGSGRTEMLKLVSGALKRDLLHGGETRIRDRVVRFTSVAQATRHGVAYVTEDRKLEGFFDEMSIADNIYAGHLACNGGAFGLTSAAKRKVLSAQWTETLQVRSISDRARVIELSGGNQQKVVIAKSMAQHPGIVLFDEPTRGVDVGAIAEIHAFLHRLADDGVAVVVVSSYLPEIVELSDRILVAKNGRIVEEFDSGATEKQIMFAAVH